MKLENRVVTTIVSDFDGTLIPAGKNKPSAKFYDVIKKLLDQNIRFIAASGRKYQDLNKIMEPYSDRIAFIAENGALVVWNGKVIHKCVINMALAFELIEDLGKQLNAEIMVSGEKAGYIVPRTQEYVRMLENNFSNQLVKLQNFTQVPEDIIKIAANFSNGVPDELKHYFHKKYDKVLLITESGNGWLDFMPKESGKGTALIKLSGIMDFCMEETAAFGDSENDMGMLGVAGIGYAMDFSDEKVKSVADCICNSVEEILERGLA